MNDDVLILGTGIIGASIAYELAKKGRRVRLVDIREAGSGASGRSAAMLECQVDSFRGDPFFAFARESLRLFPALSDELKSGLGLDIQYEPCGILQIAMADEDKAILEESLERQKRAGLRAEWWDAEDIYARYPFLSPENHGGVFFSEDGQVTGERFSAAMLAAAGGKGAEIVQNAGSVDWVRQSGSAVGVRTRTDLFRAETIIVAAGAWTDTVLAPLNSRMGIEPVRGQMMVFETEPSALPHPVYTRSRGYITPKPDGYTFVGATVERAGFDENHTPAARRQLESFAETLYPGLLQKRFRGMVSGLRPGTPDELPVIGPLPDHPNVWVAAGHSRNGMLLAPGTAKMIGAMIENRPSLVDPSPFLPVNRAVSAR